MRQPNFVITGAANKGKSSVVSALTGDDRIEIYKQAGTTLRSQKYEMTVDGRTALYVIWDTPGFENSRRLKEILLELGIQNAQDNLELFRKFYEQYKSESRFKHEIEILKPIIEGAGIVYVVDSSVPFSDSQYLNDIEIIKWTGLPRIAVLNPITDDQGIDDWRAYLEDHFSMIKIFNPYKVTFEEKLRLLDAFSHLNPDWENQIQSAIQYLREDRENILNSSAKIIRDAVLEVYSQDFEVNYNDSKSEEWNKRRLLKSVKSELKNTLSDAQSKIVNLFGFTNLLVNMDFDLSETDVLDEVAIKKYLSPHQRALIGAVIGGAAGGLVDVLLGGGGLGIPTAIGLAGGGAYGYVRNISPIDILDVTEHEGDRYRLKKIHVNLGYLIINRLRELTAKLYNRSAANRKTVTINYDFDKHQTVKLTRVLNKIVKGSQLGTFNAETKRDLNTIIHEKLQDDQKRVQFEQN